MSPDHCISPSYLTECIILYIRIIESTAYLDMFFKTLLKKIYTEVGLNSYNINFHLLTPDKTPALVYASLKI